jgi:uncharacterized alkaline shock family protein YloU
MTEETRLGRIEILPSAIAGIAAQAVLECYGVVGMVTPNPGIGLVQILRRDYSRRGVEVKIVEQQIIIDLYVVIEYGTRISEVARNIMENVKFAVEKVLGVPIAEVNVHVEGLRVNGADLEGYR